MNRLDFLKSIGIAVLAPSVLVPNDLGEYKELPPNFSKFKRWPIYPEYNHFAYKNSENLVYHYSSYVKILRNEVEYLVFVREDGIGSNEKIKERFDFSVNQVLGKYKIPEHPEDVDFYINSGFIIKYNKSIHNNYGL